MHGLRLHVKKYPVDSILRKERSVFFKTVKEWKEGKAGELFQVEGDSQDMTTTWQPVFLDGIPLEQLRKFEESMN